MSFLFGGGGGGSTTPKPVPTVQHEAVKAAGDTARRKARAARGQASTMLTEGELGKAPTLIAKLLGR